MAARLACTGFVPESPAAPLRPGGPSSAGACTLGADRVLIAAYPSTAATEGALSALRAATSPADRSLLLGSEGPNWLLIGGNAANPAPGATSDAATALGGVTFRWS